MTSSNTPASRGGLGSRLRGLIMDVILLGLFLVAGVACLDVIVKIIVLIVGYVQHLRDAEYIRMGVVVWDEGRHGRDWIGLGLTLAAAVASVALFLGGLKLRRYLLTRFVDASFESFVGKRYLISRQAGSLVSLITVISVLGVSVGVMALVVVISVMNGFDRSFTEKIMGVFGHVEIRPGMLTPGAEFTEERANEILRVLDANDDIIGASPLLRRETFVQPSSTIDAQKSGMRLYGFDFDREQNVTTLMNNVLPGGNARPGDGEVVVGIELAHRLGLNEGDTMYAFGKTVTTARGASPKMLPLRVVGVFQTGLHDVDALFGYAGISTVQQLYLTEGFIPMIHAKVRDPYSARRTAYRITAELPAGAYEVLTWDDFNRDFFEALRTEKVAMFIILMMIVLVASLNIIGTLVMVVTQKTREIGILKSIGATNAMILRIFIFHGAFIGIVGTSLGVACGLWLCRFVHLHIDQIFQLPAAVYGLDRLPVLVEPNVIGFIALCSFLVCLLAGIVPAFKAATLNPVEALRYS